MHNYDTAHRVFKLTLAASAVAGDNDNVLRCRGRIRNGIEAADDAEVHEDDVVFFFFFCCC